MSLKEPVVKHSSLFEKEQKNPAWRREVKKWREKGFSRYFSRIVAKYAIEKPDWGMDKKIKDVEKVEDESLS